MLSTATKIATRFGTTTSSRTTSTTIAEKHVVTIQNRNKHSKRQLKRLFQKHPANKRVSTRNSTLPKLSPPEERTYPQVFDDVKFLPNGWSAPPPSEEAENLTKNLPFGIERTGGKPNGTVGFLPVYSDVRLGGTKVTTLIRKVTGDKELFVKELKAVLNFSPDVKDGIRLRGSGMVVEVDGNRSREIKAWLAGLGF